MPTLPLATKQVIVLSSAWVILLFAWVLITNPDGYSIVEYMRYMINDVDDDMPSLSDGYSLLELSVINQRNEMNEIIMREVYAEAKEKFIILLTVPPICLFSLNSLLKIFIKS
ncbi:hypothetical protein ACVHIF_003489 [Vibrio cholerae]